MNNPFVIGFHKQQRCPGPYRALQLHFSVSARTAGSFGCSVHCNGRAALSAPNPASACQPFISPSGGVTAGASKAPFEDVGIASGIRTDWTDRGLESGSAELPKGSLSGGACTAAGSAAGSGSPH